MKLYVYETADGDVFFKTEVLSVTMSKCRGTINLNDELPTKWRNKP